MPARSRWRAAEESGGSSTSIAASGVATLNEMHISMILFDRMTQLDLGAPYEVFIRMPDTTVELVAKSRDVVVADGGLPSCRRRRSPMHVRRICCSCRADSA